MRVSWIAVAGAIALALPIAGLAEIAGRDGPHDVGFEPIAHGVQTSGSYAAAPAPTGPQCLLQPCVAMAEVGLRVAGLPNGTYSLWLVGSGNVHIGDADGPHEWSWSEAEDHTDKTALEVRFAGQPVLSLPVGPGERSLAGSHAARWGDASGTVHLAEIGMVSISTIADGRLDLTAPDGWALEAFLDGPGGRVALDPLEADGAGSALDARVERVALEDHDRLVVELVGAGRFPVAEATF